MKYSHVVLRGRRGARYDQHTVPRSIAWSVWMLAGCSIDAAGLSPTQSGGEGSATIGGQGPGAGRGAQGDPASNFDDAAVVVDEPSGQDSGSGATTGCDPEGTFALRIDADVRWAGTTFFDIVPIIEPGTGAFSVDALVNLTKKGTGLQATLRGCGSAVPDFSSSVAERYGVVIPEASWEKLEVRWSTTARMGCDQPGCTYSTDFLTAQIGINIPDQARWPLARETLDPSTFLDADKDGLPGLLLRTRGESDGPGYKHPPTSYLLLQRVREMMLAIRIGAALEGSLETCDRYSGTTKNMTLDTRGLGCRIDSGALCNADQLQFVDDNLPVWKIDRARWRMTRVSPAATCTDARLASP